MKVYKDYRQEQKFLLPPSLDEFVPQDHEVRIINDVVGHLDLSSLREKHSGGGAPAYDPAMILKVVIYAYSLGVYSSRKMARGLKTDTAFMYLSAMQCPDFRTLCLFRSSNADILPEIFVQVVRLCASLGMIKLGHIAIDGTKLKANASVRRSLKKEELETEIERLKAEVKGMIRVSEEIDKQEDEEHPDGDGSEMPVDLQDKERRLKKLQEAQKVLDEEKLRKVNVTDPEARLMQNKQHRIEPAYNIQVAVDDQEQVIVAAEVSQKSADYDEFQTLLEQTKQNLGHSPQQVSADCGYFRYENLEYAEREGIDAYIPDNMLEWLDRKPDSEKRYDKSNFRYDASQDFYICPEGKLLKPITKHQGKHPATVYAGESCNGCQTKDQCTRARFRSISQHGREKLVYRMRDKLRTAQGKRTYLKRMYTVEPIFGDMKLNRSKLLTSLRGLAKTRVDFLLMCLCHNIRKIIKVLREVKRTLIRQVGSHQWNPAMELLLPFVTENYF